MVRVLAFLFGMGVGYVLAGRYVVMQAGTIQAGHDLRAVGYGLLMFAVVVWLLLELVGWIARTTAAVP